jgi:hypothetical protein
VCIHPNSCICVFKYTRNVVTWCAHTPTIPCSAAASRPAPVPPGHDRANRCVYVCIHPKRCVYVCRYRRNVEIWCARPSKRPCSAAASRPAPRTTWTRQCEPLRLRVHTPRTLCLRVRIREALCSHVQTHAKRCDLMCAYAQSPWFRSRQLRCPRTTWTRQCEPLCLHMHVPQPLC